MSLERRVDLSALGEVFGFVVSNVPLTSRELCDAIGCSIVYLSCLFTVRPEPSGSGPKAHDGRPAKAPVGLAVRASGRVTPTGPQSRPRQCEAASRSESAVAAPRADRGPYRTTCEKPAALLRRATVPRTQPSAGQWNSTVRPRRADLGGGGETKPSGRDRRNSRPGRLCNSRSHFNSLTQTNDSSYWDLK